MLMMVAMVIWFFSCFAKHDYANALRIHTHISINWVEKRRDDVGCCTEWMKTKTNCIYMVTNDDDHEHSIPMNKIRMKYTHFKRTHICTFMHAYICGVLLCLWEFEWIVSEATKIVWLECYYHTPNMLSSRSKTHKKGHLMVCWFFCGSVNLYSELHNYGGRVREKCAYK